MMKLRRMRWTWHVSRMKKKRNAYRFLVGKPEYLGICGVIILRGILDKHDGFLWTGLI
jgi:hypothetical protein